MNWNFSLISCGLGAFLSVELLNEFSFGGSSSFFLGKGSFWFESEAQLTDFEGVVGLTDKKMVFWGAEVGEVVFEGGFADAAVAVVLGGSG